MVYRRSYVPGVPTSPPASNPPASSNPNNPEEKRGASPMMWVGGENFDIGQETRGGGHVFDGKHIVKVGDMTKVQLDQAAKELVFELKREAIEKRQYELMMKVALVSDTPNEFIDKVYEEPSLTMHEVPPFDPLLDDRYDSVEKIIAQIGDWLSSTNVDITTKEALQTQITELGGPAILSPTEESTEPAQIDKLKRKIGQIEEHLVPEPDAPLPPSPVEEEWPEDIPELTEVPEDPPGAEDLANAWVKLHHLQAYLTNVKAYNINVLFNMGWILEMISVCLNDLSRAKAPGTQEDAFKANLEGLNEGITHLEESGVFHD